MIITYNEETGRIYSKRKAKEDVSLGGIFQPLPPSMVDVGSACDGTKYWEVSMIRNWGKTSNEQNNISFPKAFQEERIEDA